MDAHGILTTCDLPRDRLMANQWHPNSEGGRLMALAILRSLGLTEEDASRTGDPRDKEYFRILAHVPEPRHPRYVAPTAEGKVVFGPMVAVSSFTGNAVFLYSPAGRRLAQVPVGAHPGGLAYSPRRRQLYVACEGEGTIHVIELPSLAAKAPIALDDDDYPTCIILNQKQDTAWVGTYYGCRLIEIDLEEKKIRRAIPIEGFAQSIYLLEDQNRVLVGTLESIAVVDLAAGKVANRLPLEYVGAFLPLADGRLGAIETVYWRMQALSLPGCEILAEMEPPLAARAMVRDAAGAIWAGDWKAHRLLKKGPATDALLVAEGEVAFPFGIALLDIAE
ncbi:MAG: hypothetical protein N3A66_02140 [Planctomycetota bacterium]|nr:hypothetical protein [Planctomycetota bacterium]